MIISNLQNINPIPDTKNTKHHPAFDTENHGKLLELIEGSKLPSHMKETVNKYLQ